MKFKIVKYPKKKNYLDMNGFFLAVFLSWMLPFIYNQIFMPYLSLETILIGSLFNMVFFLLIFSIYNLFFELREKKHLQVLYFSLFLGILYFIFSLFTNLYDSLLIIGFTFIAVLSGGLLKSENKKIL